MQFINSPIDWRKFFSYALQGCVGAAVYILFREWLSMAWTSQDNSILPWYAILDNTHAIVLPFTILFVGLFLRPLSSLRVREIEVGLIASLFTVALSAVIWLVFISGWVSRQPTGVPTVGLIVGVAKIAFFFTWFADAIVVFASAVAGGLIALLVAQVKKSSSLIGKILGASLALICLIVPAGAIYGRTQMGIGFIDLATRYEELKPFHARIDVQITIHGRRVDMQRTIQCSRPFTPKEEAEAKSRKRMKPYWFPNLKSFGHVFEDGSGVFIITPDFWQRMAILNAKAFALREGYVLGEHYVPLVGWTSNANDMDSFDLFIDGTAYSGANPSVKLHKIAVTRIPPGVTYDKPDEFGSLGWEYVWTTGTEYGAYVAKILQEPEWKKHERAAENLPSITEFGFALNDSDKKTAEGWSIYSGLHQELENTFIARNGQGIPNDPIVDNFGNREPSVSSIIPMRREGNTWRIFPAESGTITFYRGLQTSLVRPELPKRIILGKKFAEREDSPRREYVYDPETKELYAIGVHHFQMGRPNSVFASW